jgi:hypothetical protein
MARYNWGAKNPEIEQLKNAVKSARQRVINRERTIA